MDCTTYLRQIGKHEIAEYVERLRDNVAQLEVELIKSRRKIALQEATCRQILENYEPVRHGRWIPQDNTYTRFMCSACETRNHAAPTDYCPNCGAKMDEEEEHNGK